MEKLTGIKDKIVSGAKNFVQALKNNPPLTALICFAICLLVLILVAVFALDEFVISVCVLMVLEVLMAVLLHRAELWKHALLVVAQVVAGIVIGRGMLILICILVYLAAMVTLHVMFKRSPKA